MKIIYLHQYFCTTQMNGGTRSYEMARRWVSHGHSVHMITSWREPSKERNWFCSEESGIKVHWLPVAYSNEMNYLERIKAFFKFAVKAARRAESLSGDIIFASSTPLTIAIPAILAARKRNVPMVFEVRDLWPEVPIQMGVLRNGVLCYFAKQLERFAYKNAAHIVALSPGMVEGVASTGYPKQKISMIPNGADIDLFRPDRALSREFRSLHPELGNSPIVLYAGTLGRVNEVDYLVWLASVALRKELQCKFVVIGEGRELQKIKQLARELGVYEVNFFMYPALKKTDLPSAFAASAIITSLVADLPILEINSANKFFDGLASGTPVAINYGGWQAELLNQSGAGFVMSRDVCAAIDSLDDWLGDVERLRCAGAAARRLAVHLFSRDKLADELEAALLNVVNGQ